MSGRQSYLEVLCAEPFRVFFPLGWLCSLVGVSHWLWYYLGWIDRYSGFYHGLFQIQGFELAFAAGFLMTAMPRFLETPGARPWELALGVLLLLGGAVGLYLGDQVWSLGGLLAMLLFLIVFAGRRFPRRRDNPPPAFVFVAFGLLCGLAGVLLLWWPAADFPQLGQRLLEQGLLLGLIMAVGSYLGPRLLYGRHEDPVTQGPAAGRRLAVFALAGLALAASFLVEAGGAAEAGRLLRAAVVTAHLLVAVGIYRLPVRRWHLYLLWLSFWCVPGGLWLASLFPEHELQTLHLTFVGGFGSMTLVIATRVIVAHCGFERYWDQNTWPLAVLTLCFALALVTRVSAEFFLDYYFGMLHMAAGYWLIGALVWGLVFVPKMMPWHVAAEG
ncbi:MAG: NnrS family protein [Candidatus Latescibacteria bacterium]|nr:NnrS family protein [Candidatus Latescibacterota bacterium]